MSVTGMKQGRKVLEEGNRQEGAKPWSRKVSGEVNPSEPGFQFRKRCRGPKPQESCCRLVRRRSGSVASEGESKLAGGERRMILIKRRGARVERPQGRSNGGEGSLNQ